MAMADFIHADLHGSRFERVDLSGAQLLLVAQGDLVRLGDVLGLDSSQSLA